MCDLGDGLVLGFNNATAAAGVCSLSGWSIASYRGTEGPDDYSRMRVATAALMLLHYALIQSR